MNKLTKGASFLSSLLSFATLLTSASRLVVEVKRKSEQNERLELLEDAVFNTNAQVNAMSQATEAPGALRYANAAAEPFSEPFTREQIPSEGRIVHFVLPNGAHRPAVITNANPGGYAVAMTVFLALGDCENLGAPVHTHWQKVAPYNGTGKEPGTWHWPERV